MKYHFLEKYVQQAIRDVTEEPRTVWPYNLPKYVLSRDEMDKMYIPDGFADRFAEIIIQECMKVIQDEEIEAARAERGSRYGNRLCDIIAHRFGVKLVKLNHDRDGHQTVGVT